MVWWLNPGFLPTHMLMMQSIRFIHGREIKRTPSWTEQKNAPKHSIWIHFFTICFTFLWPAKSPERKSSKLEPSQKPRHRNKLFLCKHLSLRRAWSDRFVCVKYRHSEVKYPEYRSRQSLNSPSPGGTEMDLLVMRERPRKGIRNSGYDVSNANLSYRWLLGGFGFCNYHSYVLTKCCWE